MDVRRPRCLELGLFLVVVAERSRGRTSAWLVEQLERFPGDLPLVSILANAPKT